MRQKTKTGSASASVNTSTWKDPPSLPSPKLTHFELPISSPGLQQNSQTTAPSSVAEFDDEHRVALTPLMRQDQYDSLRRAASPHHSMQGPCCEGSAIYTPHCHYSNYPSVHESLLSQAPPTCHSVCECSLQTIPQGTLERQFPHLYANNRAHHNATLMRAAGGIHPSAMYGSTMYGSERGRSHSVSPSRRSAEY